MLPLFQKLACPRPAVRGALQSLLAGSNIYYKLILFHSFQRHAWLDLLTYFKGVIIIGSSNK